MKKIFISMAMCWMVACVFAQAPVFQSPYKDNRPVPDSLKDFSELRPTNQLISGGSRTETSAGMTDQQITVNEINPGIPAVMSNNRSRRISKSAKK